MPRHLGLSAATTNKRFQKKTQKTNLFSPTSQVRPNWAKAAVYATSPAPAAATSPTLQQYKGNTSRKARVGPCMCVYVCVMREHVIFWQRGVFAHGGAKPSKIARQPVVYTLSRCRFGLQCHLLHTGWNFILRQPPFCLLVNDKAKILKMIRSAYEKSKGKQVFTVETNNCKFEAIWVITSSVADCLLLDSCALEVPSLCLVLDFDTWYD